MILLGLSFVRRYDLGGVIQISYGDHKSLTIKVQDGGLAAIYSKC